MGLAETHLGNSFGCGTSFGLAVGHFARRNGPDNILKRAIGVLYRRCVTDARCAGTELAATSLRQQR